MQAILETSVQAATLIGILATLGTNLFALVRSMQLARETRRARTIALAAAQRAEEASRLAADHSKEALNTLNTVADHVRQVELSTNSMKDALVAATAASSDAAGEKRGIGIGRAQVANEKEEPPQ